MKLFSKRNKKALLFLVIIIFIVAGLLDIKYEGLMYQQLPKSVQSYLANF